MQISQLTLKKFNNIERQIQSHRSDILEAYEDESHMASIHLKSGRIIKARNFYEFYINDKPLINHIGEAYWNKDSTQASSDFFDSNVGTLGSFGDFWDDIYVSILLRKRFDKKQNKLLSKNETIKTILDADSVSKSKIEDKIWNHLIEDFLFYRCQFCGDSQCGGIALKIVKKRDTMIWTDYDKLNFEFKFDAYEKTLNDYLKRKK